jgi:hypothetical protein
MDPRMHALIPLYRVMLVLCLKRLVYSNGAKGITMSTSFSLDQKYSRVPIHYSTKSTHQSLRDSPDLARLAIRTGE